MPARPTARFAKPTSYWKPARLPADRRSGPAPEHRVHQRANRGGPAERDVEDPAQRLLLERRRRVDVRRVPTQDREDPGEDEGERRRVSEHAREPSYATGGTGGSTERRMNRSA